MPISAFGSEFCIINTQCMHAHTTPHRKSPWPRWRFLAGCVCETSPTQAECHPAHVSQTPPNIPTSDQCCLFDNLPGLRNKLFCCSELYDPATQSCTLHPETHLLVALAGQQTPGGQGELEGNQQTALRAQYLNQEPALDKEVPSSRSSCCEDVDDERRAHVRQLPQ